jgi:hypothetical protein
MRHKRWEMLRKKEDMRLTLSSAQDLALCPNASNVKHLTRCLGLLSLEQERQKPRWAWLTRNKKVSFKGRNVPIGDALG